MVLALGLATTSVLYASISNVLRARSEKELRDEVRLVSDAIHDSVRDQVSILYAVAGAVSAEPRIDQGGFAALYESLRRGNAAKVPASIGVTAWRPWERRGELAVDAASRRVPGFRLRPQSPRAEAHAVVLIQPFAGKNATAPGYDMHVESVRAAAIDRARRTGSPAMTSGVVLALDADEPKPVPSFVLYAPVVPAGGVAPTSLVFCGLRARSLFASLGDRLARSDAGLRLGSVGEGRRMAIFDQLPDGGAVRSRRFTLPLDEVGQTLEGQVLIGPGFGTQAKVQAYVAPTGICLSLLLFALATTLLRAHENSERRGAQQFLLSEVGRLTSDTFDDEALLWEIARSTASILDAVCRIDLQEPDGTLKAISTRTENRETLEAIERDHPRWEHDPYVRAAVETGETQRADGYKPRDEIHRQRHAQLGIGHVVVVPMRTRDRAIGVITLTRPKGCPALTDDEVAVAEAIAGRIALAVDNARLYRAAQMEVEERRLAEAEVRRLNEDLERIVADRTRDLEVSNHELESFCYSVSHDLRTPLRSLDGFSRVLQEDYGDRLDEQGLDYLDRIRASAKRMDELITALLTLSRLTRREIVPSEVDVSTMVHDQMQDLDPERKVDLSVEDGLRVTADPRMFAVVLDNLLSNAVKFSGRAATPQVYVGRADEGSIFVRDNGTGFDMAYANKLFQPFERLHSVREFPGHGIGLATVERIVRRHGGTVRAEGTLGEGATFFVRFP